MTQDDTTRAVLGRYQDLAPLSTWGELAFFYNPGGVLKRGVYFCTLKDKDGDHDRASNLNRDGVYRLNFKLAGVSFNGMFGPKPNRPDKGGVVDGPWDFTELDTLMPHPVYAWMGWVSVLSPSESTWLKLFPQLDAAYAVSKTAFKKRIGC